MLAQKFAAFYSNPIIKKKEHIHNFTPDTDRSLTDNNNGNGKSKNAGKIDTVAKAAIAPMESQNYAVNPQRNVNTIHYQVE